MKQKNVSIWHDLWFLVVWAGTAFTILAVLAVVVFYVAFTSVMSNGELPIILLTVIAFIAGGLLGFIQMFIIQWKFQRKLASWAVLTALTWGSGVLLSPIFSILQIIDWVVILGYMVLPAIVQWFVLRHHVHAAWLWILAAAVSFPVSISLAYAGDADAGLLRFCIMLLVPNIISGLTLLWLFKTNIKEQHEA